MPRPEDDLVKNMAEAALVDSQGSIDYSDNAKAIALMSPIVQSRLIDALASGSTLESVDADPSFASSILDYRIRFTLVRPDGEVDPEASFVVSTELPTRSVQRIVGINDTLPTEIPSVPFGLAVASKSRQHRVSLDELSGKLGLEWDFLQGLSLGDILEKLKKRGYSLPVGADTAYDTNTQTTDFCNVSSNYGTQTQSQGVTDDSHNDTEPDTTMDVTIDTVTDYKNDPTPTLPE